MKKILIAFLLGIIFVTSCDNKLLNTESHSKYTEGNFWNSKQAAEAYLNGAYAVLRYSGLWGGSTPLVEETASPNAWNKDNNDKWNTVANGAMNASTGGIVSRRWAQCYEGIGRCNSFLERIDEVVALDDDQDLRERMKGEAIFLRAYFYSVLERYYGDAPLILETPDPHTQDTMSRTSRKKIVAQILKDLDDAAKVLPLSYSADDLGRATKGSALALKAKVLLFEASPLVNVNNELSKWKEVRDAAKRVMDMNEYSLFPDYRTLFLPENENNQEVIFNVEFVFPDEGNDFDLINRQYNRNAPLQGLVEAYEMDNGKKITESGSNYDSNNPYENRDPRFYATIVYPGAKYMGEIIDADRFANTGYGVLKYSIYGSDAPPAELSDLKTGQSYTNYIIIRYADILLTYSEAQNEYSGPDQSVYDAINLVRRRSGMPDLSSGLDQNEMRDAIRHERRIEFACEGYYYTDIRRWKIAEDVMNAPIFNYSGSLLEKRHFDKSKNYWWPISQSQLDLGDNLVQTPNY